MFVVTRDNTQEPVRFDEISKRLAELCAREPRLSLDPVVITKDTVRHVGDWDGMSTERLDDLTADLCADRANEDLEYGVLAARILVSSRLKALRGRDFLQALSSVPNIDPAVVVRAERHRERIAACMDYDRDYGLTYFGLRTLMKGYLNEFERPQDLWMRVAISLHEDIEQVVRATTTSASWGVRMPRRPSSTRGPSARSARAASTATQGGLGGRDHSPSTSAP